ncbi:MAG: zf-HC2 domain-containing protein [Endomicrobia bacterium]|nr:zf-HC2 domain-containing protein [Endomicrobiia bacterium]MCX7940648.1 zf-HC2 domain-containing protein [Endomicrobiia bacterium]MDW8056382.1 zf-HC2 domain-containing protein [Elusimicrobiota bacterium]
MIIKCKDVFELLSELYDDELEENYEDLIQQHINECENCLALLHTFERTLDLFHSLQPIKLEQKRKQEFHRWLKVEIKRIVIKRY